MCRRPERWREPKPASTRLTQRASSVSKTQPLGTQGRRFRVIKNWSCPIPKGHLDKYALGRHDSQAYLRNLIPGCFKFTVLMPWSVVSLLIEWQFYKHFTGEFSLHAFFSNSFQEIKIKATNCINQPIQTVFPHSF